MTLYNLVMAATSRMQADLRAHGCGVEIVGVADGEVRIRLVTTAGTCELKAYTVKVWFERSLKETVPEIRRVRLVAIDAR